MNGRGLFTSADVGRVRVKNTLHSLKFGLITLNDVKVPHLLGFLAHTYFKCHVRYTREKESCNYNLGVDVLVSSETGYYNINAAALSQNSVRITVELKVCLD